MSYVNILWVVEHITEKVKAEGLSEVLVNDTLNRSLPEILESLHQNGLNARLVADSGFTTIVVTK